MELLDVDVLREHSRVLVRELGLLQGTQHAFGASLSECHLVQLVRATPYSTAGKLAAELNLDKSTTSRLVASVIKKGWLQAEEDPEDKRRSLLSLTKAGQELGALIDQQAREHVSGALELLGEEEQAEVLRGMRLYSTALQKLRRCKESCIEPLKRGDQAALAQLILQVLEEYGCRGGGFASEDAELHSMHASYQGSGRAYFVVRLQGRIVGGAGIAPLEGGDGKTCELRKMYLASECRGLGLGARLLQTCLQAAREAGYKRCYLETTSQMRGAQKLYLDHGFVERPDRLGSTGHWGCDKYYERSL